MAVGKIVFAFSTIFLIQIWTSFVVAQFGFGNFGGGGLGGGGFGSRGGITARISAPNSALSTAVRAIVHPDAKPTREMIRIARRHRGPPENQAEMMEYTPHMTFLAFQHGVRPNASKEPTFTEMTEYIMERGRQHMQNTSRRSSSSSSREWAVNPNQTASTSSGSTGSANAATSGTSGRSSNSATSGSTGNANSATSGSGGSTSAAISPGSGGNAASTGNVVSAGKSTTTTTARTTTTPPPYNFDVDAFLNNYIMLQMLSSGTNQEQGLFNF